MDLRVENIREIAEIQDDSLRQHIPEQFAEWRDRVLMRNIFGFPNEAPRFSRVGTKRFVKGERVEVRLSALIRMTGTFLFLNWKRR